MPKILVLLLAADLRIRPVAQDTKIHPNDQNTASHLEIVIPV